MHDSRRRGAASCRRRRPVMRSVPERLRVRDRLPESTRRLRRIADLLSASAVVSRSVRRSTITRSDGRRVVSDPVMCGGLTGERGQDRRPAEEPKWSTHRVFLGALDGGGTVPAAASDPAFQAVRSLSRRTRAAHDAETCTPAAAIGEPGHALPARRGAARVDADVADLSALTVAIAPTGSVAASATAAAGSAVHPRAAGRSSASLRTARAASARTATATGAGAASAFATASAATATPVWRSSGPAAAEGEDQRRDKELRRTSDRRSGA
jgi:hypothetical protein